MPKVRITIFVLAMVILSCAAASADTFTFNVGNSGLAGAPLPFGTVNVNQVNSNTVSFAISMNHYLPNTPPNASANDIQYTIGVGGFEFNLANTSNLLLSNVSATNVNGNAISNIVLSTGAHNYDGFGALNVNIATTNNGNNANNSAVTFNFTLTRTVGTLSIANFQALNSANCPSQPCTFVAHVNEFDLGTGRNLNTGFGGTSGGSEVPEPASLALFGSGLLTLGGVVRRKIGK